MKLRMKRNAHVLAGTLLISALVPLGLSASAGAAFAASCSGYTCHGLDPASRCTDTKDKIVLADDVQDPLAPEDVAVLHNKYSKGCNSNWAWAALTSAGYNDGASLVVLITTTDSRGNLESMCYPGPNSTGALNEYCYESTYRGTAGAYTDMVDGTNVTQAYVYVYASDGALIASAEADL
jgi:hypothetical protein